MNQSRERLGQAALVRLGPSICPAQWWGGTKGDSKGGSSSQVRCHLRDCTCAWEKAL